MVSIRRRLLLAGLLLATSGGAAFGGTYADPSGFSFTYPEGWTAVTRASLGDVHQALPQEVKDWVAKNNLDLNRVAVVLVRNGGGEFLENLNVVVDKQQIPVDDKTLRQLTDGLPGQYRSMGATVDDVRGRVQKVGSRDAVVVDFRSRLPGVPYPLRQRQVMIPGGGNTYIVTCTARAESFDQHLPTFEKILANFQAPRQGLHVGGLCYEPGNVPHGP
jgi:hypothetical protein